MDSEALDLEESPSDSVETVIGAVLGAAVIFLLLQVPVCVVLMVFSLLLPELGVMSPAAGEKIGIAAALLCEAILIVALVRMIRAHMPRLPRGTGTPEDVTPRANSRDFERDLEKLMFASAVIAVVASLLLGAGAFGAKIAWIVIEAFAALFLLLAIVTRWLLTRRVSAWAVAALALTLASLWLATRQP